MGRRPPQAFKEQQKPEMSKTLQMSAAGRQSRGAKRGTAAVPAHGIQLLGIQEDRSWGAGPSASCFQNHRTHRHIAPFLTRPSCSAHLGLNLPGRFPLPGAISEKAHSGGGRRELTPGPVASSGAKVQGGPGWMAAPSRGGSTASRTWPGRRQSRPAARWVANRFRGGSLQVGKCRHTQTQPKHGAKTAREPEWHQST